MIHNVLSDIPENIFWNCGALLKDCITIFGYNVAYSYMLLNIGKRLNFADNIAPYQKNLSLPLK